MLLDFRGQVPVDISVMDGWQAQSTPNGLHIVAPVAGRILLKNPSTLPIHAVFVQAAVRVPQEAELLWNKRSAPNGTYVKLPITLKPNERQIATLPIDTSAYKQWDTRPDILGLTLPGGSEIYLQGIELLSFTLLERLQAVWQSFWRFDDFGGYSINFIWGPMLTTTPVGVLTLFTSLPPRGVSAVWIGYIFLALTACSCWVWTRLTRKRSVRTWWRYHPATIVLLGVLTTFWIGLDLRMGAELLSYAWHDYRTYLAPRSGPPVLRTFGDLHDVVNRAVTALGPAPRFGLITLPQSAVQPIVRYRALPALMTEDLQAPVTDWLVIARPDVAVNASGMLTIEGQPALGPGRIVERFTEQSFLYTLVP